MNDIKTSKVQLTGAINARPNKSNVVRTNVRSGAVGHYACRGGWGLGG